VEAIGFAKQAANAIALNGTPRLPPSSKSNLQRHIRSHFSTGYNAVQQPNTALAKRSHIRAGAVKQRPNEPLVPQPKSAGQPVRSTCFFRGHAFAALFTRHPVAHGEAFTPFLAATR